MSYDNTDPSAYLRALWDGKERSTNTKIENVKGIYVGTDRDDDLALRLKRLITNAATRRDPRLPFTADNRAPERVSSSSAKAVPARPRFFRRHSRAMPPFRITSTRVLGARS